MRGVPSPVFENDIEAVPRAGGVSVTARKADGEIFRGETVQIGVARLCSELMQLCRSAVLAECSAHRLGFFIRERAVMRAQKADKIVYRNIVAVS